MDNIRPVLVRPVAKVNTRSTPWEQGLRVYRPRCCQYVGPIPTNTGRQLRYTGMGEGKGRGGLVVIHHLPVHRPTGVTQVYMTDTGEPGH